MNTLILMQALLVMHLTGLTLLAGTTVAEYVTFRTFSNRFKIEGKASGSLLNLMSGLAVILAIGGGLLLISGIGLMTVTNGVYAHQLWFKIKIAIIFVLVLNGFLVGNRQGIKLRKNLSKKSQDVNKAVKRAMTNINVFYIVQMGLFLVIVMLAVFKLN